MESSSSVTVNSCDCKNALELAKNIGEFSVEYKFKYCKNCSKLSVHANDSEFVLSGAEFEMCAKLLNVALKYPTQPNLVKCSQLLAQTVYHQKKADKIAEEYSVVSDELFEYLDEIVHV